MLVVAAVIAVFGVAAAVVAPRVVLERAKDPGLGVRDLHGEGVTGAGIHVAIIDGQLRRDHVEYADRLVCYGWNLQGTDLDVDSDVWLPRMSLEDVFAVAIGFEGSYGPVAP